MKHHKQICKLLIVGHRDMQVQTGIDRSRSITLKKVIEDIKHNLDEDGKQFFKLFEESTLKGSRAAARKMKKIAKRQTKTNQKCLLLHSLRLLARSDSEMLSWPNSPLLVLLHFVGPSELSGNKLMRVTPLYHLAELADPSDYSTHENQLILAKQLIEHGANVNAVSIPQGSTPLHAAGFWGNVTNLDFVELLLEKGADPNAQDHQGMTPVMHTVPFAPGAAKFLLNWPTTDVTITEGAGASFLAMVRLIIQAFSYNGTGPDNPEMVQHQLLLQQWREIEDMLVERGAIDPGIAHSD